MEVTNVLSEDRHIQEVLKTRSTEELIAFREKLQRMDFPRAWAIRFFILKELLSRHLVREFEFE